MKKKKALGSLVGLLLIYGTIVLGISMFGPPANLGLQNGRFAPCPDKPNCVSSHETEESDHYIAPLKYSLPDDEVRGVILQTISGQKRTVLKEQKDDYFHVVCITLVMRFRDDFEIYIDRRLKEIHFRSASRIGYSDLGVNRKRVEAFKVLLVEAMKQK